MRWVFEEIRSEIRQYTIESDQDEEPFGWDERLIVYQRVTNEEDKPLLGTERDVQEPDYASLGSTWRTAIPALRLAVGIAGKASTPRLKIFRR